MVALRPLGVVLKGTNHYESGGGGSSTGYRRGCRCAAGVRGSAGALLRVCVRWCLTPSLREIPSLRHIEEHVETFLLEATRQGCGCIAADTEDALVRLTLIVFLYG